MRLSRLLLPIRLASQVRGDVNSTPPVQRSRYIQANGAVFYDAFYSTAEARDVPRAPCEKLEPCPLRVNLLTGDSPAARSPKTAAALRTDVRSADLSAAAIDRSHNQQLSNSVRIWVRNAAADAPGYGREHPPHAADQPCRIGTTPRETLTSVTQRAPVACAANPERRLRLQSSSPRRCRLPHSTGVAHPTVRRAPHHTGTRRWGRRP